MLVKEVSVGCFKNIRGLYRPSALEKHNRCGQKKEKKSRIDVIRGGGGGGELRKCLGLNPQVVASSHFECVRLIVFSANVGVEISCQFIPAC